jgi:hypothetical protein
MKRGLRLPFNREAVPLRFGDYLVRGNLPAVPKSFGHVGAEYPPASGGWGALGNITAGDCTIAGACHETQTWYWATQRPIPTFTDGSAIADYSKALVDQGSAPYNPEDEATDTGLDPVALAKWRQAVGITDAAGGVHKITAYASIADPEELDLACYLFGAAAICWNLPDSAEQQFESNQPWSDLGGSGTGGHYTAYVGRNSAGNRMVVTWGDLQAATDSYVSKYLVGGLAYLSREYLLSTGNSPEAINFDQLNADLAELTS